MNAVAVLAGGKRLPPLDAALDAASMPPVGGRGAVARAVVHAKKDDRSHRAPTETVRPEKPAGSREWPRRLRWLHFGGFFDPLFKHQRRAAAIYRNKRVQYSIAALIAINFVCNIVESQIDPWGYYYADVWQSLEDVFNILFLLEILLNAYAHWFAVFWKSGWNYFDVLVVAVGMISVVRVDLPGSLSLLRMLRAFRVFRLFKRIKSLNRIVVSLIAAVPGITNAAFIMFLVMCIYSILGVEFYASFGESGFYNNTNGVHVGAISERELFYGEEYFGTFSAALFTMFQVLTSESWAEAIARPLIFRDNIYFRLGSAFFFVTFILLNSVVLINVVVAVLLEKCIAPATVGDTPPLPSMTAGLEFGDSFRRAEADWAKEMQLVAAVAPDANAKPATDDGGGGAMLPPPPRNFFAAASAAREAARGGPPRGYVSAAAAAQEAKARSLVDGEVEELMLEVSKLREHIPLLLMAVQAQARQIRTMSSELSKARATRN